MATTERAPSVLLLYVASAGFNQRHFSSHVYAWRLELDGRPIAASHDDHAKLISGSTDKGAYEAILEALPHAPPLSTFVLVTTKGSELHWVFAMETREDRQRAGYRKKSTRGKRLWGNHELIRQVDTMAEAKGITLTAAEAQTDDQRSIRYIVEDAAKEKLKDAVAASESEMA